MAARKMTGRQKRVTPSAGNVFADLGFREAAAELAKAELAHRIVRAIRGRGLTQHQAAEVLGIDQPGVSHLVRGNLKRFSMDRLFRFLNLLGRDVEIVVRTKPRSRSRAAVRVAPAGGRSRQSA